MMTKLTAPNRWIIWFFAGLFYTYEMILRVSPSVMTYGIMSEYDLNATSFGFLTSFYYYAYVALQIPSGLLVDKFGVRLVVTLSALLCAIGALLFATTESLYVAKSARFIIGAGSACAFVSCLKVASDRFAKNQFPLIASLSNVLGTLGGALAGKPLAIFVQSIGWRESLLVLGIFGFFLAAFCWFFIQNSQKNEKPIKLTRHRLLAVVTNPFVLIVGMVGGLMYVPISAFAELWAIPFLMKSQSVSISDASTFVPLIFIGMMCGAPTIARLVPSFGSIRLMKTSAIVLAVLFLFIMFLNIMPYFMSPILFTMAGFAVGGQVLCFSIVRDQIDARLTATAMAVTNALVMTGGVIFQPLFGVVLDFFWDGQQDAAGVAIYSLFSFQVAVFSVVVSMIVSFAALFYVKNRHNQLY